MKESPDEKAGLGRDSMQPTAGTPKQEEIASLRRELELVQKQNLAFAKDLARTFSTERQKTRMLSRTQDQLARSAKLATLGQMVAAMAHDVGNMISPIGGYADMLLMCPDLPENGKKFAGKIQEACGRANGILRSLTDFGSHRGGQRTPVQLESIVKAAISMLEYGFARKGLKIVTNMEQSLPTVLADAGQLEQVLVNLMVNAQHAMEKKGEGEVQISAYQVSGAAKGKGGNVSKETHKNIACVVLKVTDQGQGILPAVMEHIFEPFFTTKEKGKGTGLGLFICHDIIEQHEGVLDVESTVGVGTTFSITLPAYTAPKPNEPARQ